MKSRYVCIALLVGILTISCSDDSPTVPEEPGGPEPPGQNVASREIGPDGGEVASQDGDLTLTFPEGALDRTETITVEKLGEEDLDGVFDGVVDDLGVGNAWELGPDGLEFEEAVTAEFATDRTPVEDGDSLAVASEFLFTVDDGAVAALDGLGTVLDTVTNEVVVRGELSHFTPLVTSRANNGVSFFVLDVPETKEVDVPFDVRAVIGESTAGPLAEIVTLQGPARYMDDSSAPLTAEFSPATQDMERKTGEDEGSGNFEEDFSYVCTDAGLGVFDARLAAEVTFELESGTVTAESYADFLTTVECVEEAPETVALTVQKDGDGNGTVVSQPDGITCGADCQQEQADFEAESSVILAAEPADGSVFAGWSGDIGDADPEASTVTLTMDAARTVTATFSAEDAGSGAVQVTGFSGEFTSPTAIEFTAGIEYTGSIGDLEVEFDYGDGASDAVDDPEETGEDEFTATIDYDYETTGAFMPAVTAYDTRTGESDSESAEIQEVTLTVDREGEGTVSGIGGFFGAEVINCGTDCVEPHPYSPDLADGEPFVLPILLIPYPADGYVFAGWDGDLVDSSECSELTPEDCIAVPMDRDRTVTATFEPEGSGNELCIEQPLEPGTQFPWGGQVRENDPDGSTDVQATVDISGAAEFVPGTQDADRGTWTTFTEHEGVLDIGTTAGGEEIAFSFDVVSTGAGTATYTFSASDEGGVRGTFVCDFHFE